MLRVSPQDFLKFPRDDTKESTLELSSTSTHPVTYKVSFNFCFINFHLYRIYIYVDINFRYKLHHLKNFVFVHVLEF